VIENDHSVDLDQTALEVRVSRRGDALLDASARLDSRSCNR